MSRQQEQKGFFKTLFSKWWAWALVPVACIALIFTRRDYQLWAYARISKRSEVTKIRGSRKTR
ncbi:hypothetical protein F6Y05_21535 [Bacillus megaterium]|nr:hypothetical protein [Priestia megaterium]